jgi:hypothetical protein
MSAESPKSCGQVQQSDLTAEQAIGQLLQYSTTTLMVG